MAETPMTFNMSSNRTVKKIVDKNVGVKTTEHVVKIHSCFRLYGKWNKVKTYSSFQVQNYSKRKISKSHINTCTSKRWMDEDGCRLWTNQERINHLDGLQKEVSLVKYCSSEGHVQSTPDKFCKKKAVEMENTDLAVIPKGLTTSILQPLDVSINKLFKNIVWHFLNQ